MNEAKFYTQNHSVINGRNVWLYLISCPIGNIFIIEYEQKDLSLMRVFRQSNDEAEKLYDKISIKMVTGNL